MTFGAGERIDILIVVMALVAVHLGINPDWFCEVWGGESG